MKRIYFLLMITLLLSTSLFSQIGHNAIILDGNDDYISLPSAVYFDDNTFTIEAWVYLKAYDNWCRLIDFANGSPSDNVIAALSKGTSGYPHLDVYVGGSSTGGCASTTQIPLNTWSHIAYVLNGTNAYIYLNGKLIGSSTTMQTPTNITRTNNYIGESAWTGDDNTEMQIDEFRIWSDAKSIDFIRENMYNELTGGESNLLVYFKMAEGTGTSLDDASSNSYTGTLHGGPTWVASGALDGARKALDFDGSNDYINFSSYPSYNNTAISIEAWIKPNFNNEEKPIVTWFSANNNVVEFRRASGRLEFGMNDGSFGAVAGNTTINSGNWTHVAVTKDGNNIKLYVNGMLDASGTLTKTNVPSQFNIAFLPHYNTYFQGQIDEIRIWNDVRTETEIRENMTKSLVGNEANLVAYYRFNEGDGTTLYDYTSNGYNGALTNMDASSDWVSSTAFNTWIGSESTSWSTSANWSDGVPSSSYSAGIYKWTLANVTTYEATINGTPTINNLLISSTSTPTLSSGITVNSNLLLEKNMSLNGQTVTIGSSGTLVEGSGVFSGTTGQITTTRSLNNITAQNVGGLGAVITTSANMGSTTITRTHSAGGFNNRSILRQYNIVPTTNTGLNATLTFNYLESELNGNTEANLKAYKSTNSGTLWTYAGGTVNSGNNNLTLTGLNSFSLWTLSDKALNEIIYVDIDATGGNNDGSDWTNAFTSFQSALNIASSGNKIWVAEGIYKPSKESDGTTDESRKFTFKIIQGVEIYGGFAGTETLVSQRTDFGENGANKTILDGDINGNDNFNVISGGYQTPTGDDNCYHVVYYPSGGGFTSASILDGFIIQGGYANSGVGSFYYGAGILFEGGSPMINNIIIKNNQASSGAGLFIIGSSSPVIKNTIIHSNLANDGGAIYAQGTGTPTFTNGIIFNNIATNNGGGIVNALSNVITFNNVTITKNSASVYGGGIYNNGSSSFNNSIIWGNIAGNPTYPGHQIFNYGNVTGCNYSCVANGTGDRYITSGSIMFDVNSIILDPKFANAGNDDYRLFDNSPCLDAGSDAYNSETYDIRGVGYSRKLLKTNSGSVGTIDMGAYEFKSGTDPVSCTNPTNAGTIAGAKTICNNTAPPELTSSALPTGHSGDLEYKWQKSTTSSIVGFTDIANSNSAAYTPGTLTQTTWFKRLARVDCAVDWSGAVASNVIQVSILPTTVYVSVDYNESTTGWGVSHFNNAVDVMNLGCSNITVNISDNSFTGKLDLDGYTFIVGDEDFTVNGDISNGLIQTTGDGYLIQTATPNQPLTFPITDGTHNYTVTITCGNNPNQPIKVKINNNKTVTGTITSPFDFIDISGETNLNATITMRLDKAVLGGTTIPENYLIRRWNGSRYVPIPQNTVTITDQGDYYLITITSVNQF